MTHADTLGSGLGGSLSRNHHSSGRLARSLAALGDKNPWWFLDKPPHAAGQPVHYTVHWLRLGRKLVKEPPRFWSPCTATGRARRPEPWWFLDKPPHAAGRPVHCTLASAREEACQGTTTVLVALHGHWPRNTTRTLVVPGQATLAGRPVHCTLASARAEACHGRLARPLAALGDQNPGGSWTSHLMRRGDLYTVHWLRLGRKLVKEALAVRGDQNCGGYSDMMI